MFVSEYYSAIRDTLDSLMFTDLWWQILRLWINIVKILLSQSFYLYWINLYWSRFSDKFLPMILFPSWHPLIPEYFASLLNLVHWLNLFYHLSRVSNMLSILRKVVAMDVIWRRPRWWSWFRWKMTMPVKYCVQTNHICKCYWEKFSTLAWV